MPTCMHSHTCTTKIPNMVFTHYLILKHLLSNVTSQEYYYNNYQCVYYEKNKSSMFFHILTNTLNRNPLYSNQWQYPTLNIIYNYMLVVCWLLECCIVYCEVLNLVHAHTDTHAHRHACMHRHTHTYTQ